MEPTTPLLPGTFNSRDLGGLPADRGMTRFGRLFRSDAPLRLGRAGHAALRKLGVATAIDLREAIERKLDRADLDQLSLELRWRPVLGGDFELHGMGLEAVYDHVLDHRGPMLTAAVASLAEPRALPALVFCSAGKDRTGLVVALVLGAIGVPDSAIVADYARSEQNMTGAFRAAVSRRAHAAGISEQELAVKVGAPPALMRNVLARLHEHHGGPAGYLHRNGLTDAEFDRLHDALVEPRAASAA